MTPRALGCAALALACACGAQPPPPAPRPPVLTLSLDRAAGGSDVLVTVHLADAGGAAVVGAAPSVTAEPGAVSAVRELGGGDYAATVTPAAVDAEVVITARAAGAAAAATVLALAHVDEAWGQPEAVRGLVNTPAWEDGANVSPDGEWLIVSSYVPIDLLRCVLDGGTDATPSCLAVIGPSAAPERPGMLGAERIHGATYDPVCPDLGITQPAGPPFFPTAAYGFHRQADGSFGEPFVIGFDAGGCVGPYGVSFAAAPAGAAAGLVFAYQDPAGDPGTHLWYAPVTLGQANLLGTYRAPGGQLAATGFTPSVLPPRLPTRQGNPAYGGGYLWWDDEDLQGGARDLFFAPVSGTLPDVSAGAPRTVGVSAPTAEEIQPSLDGADLYWFGDAAIHTATLTAGADPALAGSWTAPVTVLGPGGAGAIVATGEPTVAHAGAGKELYFVYVQRTATGYDANVGRVKAR